MPASCSPSSAEVSVSFVNAFVNPRVNFAAPVYVFVGSIILEQNWLRIAAGTIIGLVGLGYVGLEFVPSIEPPSNMRDADAGWGAEQV